MSVLLSRFSGVLVPLLLVGPAFASFEPNNTVQQATPLASGLYQIASVGQDWYRLEASPGTLHLHMTPAAGTDVNMVLYNSQMQIVASDFRQGAETISFPSSESGVYFVQIYPTAANTAHYSLQVSLPSGAWSRTLDFGPIRDVSVALYDIDNDGKDEIFVGTSKALDAQGREVRPAGFIALEDDGSIKWAVSFPAISGPDPQTGHVYQTSSVSSSPAFADLTGNGKINIIVGVGADTQGDAGPNVVGQPGDKGGVYALNPDGSILWFHQALDRIGGPMNTGEGRPDGVYGAPVVFDIDGDGIKEVIVNGWDQGVSILDGRNGQLKRHVHLADTIWATPRVADLDGDNRFEILVSADITENPDARTRTGGIFHVLSADGAQNVPGFDQPIGNPAYEMLRGKWEEQSLWSSPVTADLDGDGKLEIAYGTGNFFHDERGSFIKIWNHNGTQRHHLPTQGRTFATPLIADLDGDGLLEILATTLDGWVHAWNHDGSSLFNVRPVTFGNGNGDSNPIFSSPIAVDLDGDGQLEILFAKGAQLVILRADGTQISRSNVREFIFEFFKGSPAAKDIDGDGHIDIISGGTTGSKDQAVVYRWASPFDAPIGQFVDGRHQLHQSQTNIRDFVQRFYQLVLQRNAEPAGMNYWVDNLATGIIAGADIAEGFMFSQEFENRNLNNAAYVDVLYRTFFDREAELAGHQFWVSALNSGVDRSSVLHGFIHSQEFKAITTSYGILAFR